MWFTPCECGQCEQLRGGCPGANHIVWRVGVCLCLTLPIVCLNSHAPVERSGRPFISIRIRKEVRSVRKLDRFIEDKVKYLIDH